MTQPILLNPTLKGALTALPPLSLYVHFPWCVQKCPYCDFNSHELKKTSLPEKAYLEALIQDLESSLPLIWGRKIHSIFMGGGTPSLISPEGIDSFLADVRARLPLSAEIEITLEANPGTLENGGLAAFKAAGVNRLSLGVQSFNDVHLSRLGRIHRQKEIEKALEEAQCFETFNLDIMYALPEQTPTQAAEDLHQALQSGATHLSFYHLTIEPNTAFFHAPPASLPEEEDTAQMEDHAAIQLSEAGFEQYEVSAFSKKGHRARHNVNYWQFGDYLGIGAGAHSKLSFPDRLIRQRRPKHPEAYFAAVQKGQPVEEETPISLADRPFEFMMNALRLKEGVPLRLFEERTGLSPQVLDAARLEAERRGWLEPNPIQLKTTAEGFRFLNSVLMLFC